MAEFGFCKVKYGTSARHDWKATHEAKKAADQEAAERERAERLRQEEEERMRKEKEEEERRRQAELAERRRPKQPWWMKHTGGISNMNWGETTPPPEPAPIYNPDTNSYSFEKTDELLSNVSQLLGKSKDFLNQKSSEQTEDVAMKSEEKEYNSESAPPVAEQEVKRGADAEMSSVIAEEALVNTNNRRKSFGKSAGSVVNKKNEIPSSVLKKGGVRKSGGGKEEHGSINAKRKNSIFKSKDHELNPADSAVDGKSNLFCCFIFA